MLDKFSYVFIIGAGANCSYGFPLGTELYDQIRVNYANFVKNYYDNRNFGSTDIEELIKVAEEFVEELALTNGVSIDKYININKRFQNDGVLAIASQIFLCEQNSILPWSKKPENDWYTYLYTKLIQGLNSSDELLNIGKNKISFIIFNYDRSLEHYLFENLYGLLKNADISRKQVAEAFNEIEFIHVYGQIGKLPWQCGIHHNNASAIAGEKDVTSYGEPRCYPLAIANKVNKMIDVMYNSRRDNQALVRARELIKSADRIMFLGFGFDEQNLSILNLPELLEGKRVYGTAFGATNNELLHIESILAFKTVQEKSKIYPFDCLMLLREHLI